MWSVIMGQIAADALKDWWYEVLVDKDLREGYVGFCDATQMKSFEVTAANLLEFRTLIDMSPQRMYRKMAVLVQEGDVWRVAEKITSMGADLGLPIKMFFDRDAACDWLGLSPEVVARITASYSDEDSEG